ncbi:hypothetical protein SLA2020_383780, partial [Shorea laevis]
ENLSEPGERSRLSFYKDVHNVLKYYEGINKVIGLKGFFPETSEKSFSTKALARMSKIRILQLRNANFVGSFEHFLKELSWLFWERYPQVSIPSSLNLKKLVVLRLRNRKLKYIWDVSKVLKNLKVLDLSHSHDLIGTSDISGLLNIEKLIFKDCINLIEVHQSIGNLSKLIYLDLENCQNLVHLPIEICKLRFLENLNLHLCSKLEELPEDFGNMESLKELSIGCTAIKHLPMSIGHLKNLTDFSWNYERSLLESPSTHDLSPLWSLASVKVLNLSYCNLSDNSFPQDLSGLPNIEMLLLRGNTFHCFPSCLSQLWKLKELDVSECDLSSTTCPAVVSFPSLHKLNLSKNNFSGLPVDLSFLPLKTQVIIHECKKLQVIEAESHTAYSTANCTSLERVRFKGEIFNFLGKNFTCFSGAILCQNYYGCEKLVEIQGSFKLKPLSIAELAKLERLFRLKPLLNKRLHFCNIWTFTWIKSRPIQGLSEYGCRIYSIFLAGGMIPDWFNHQNNGGSMVVDVPQDGSFQMLAVCVVYCSMKDLDSGYPILSIAMKDDINSSSYQQKYAPMFIGFHAKDEVMWVSYWRAPSLVNECRKLRVKVKTQGSQPSMLKGIGLRLLHEDELDHQLSEELDHQLSGKSLAYVFGTGYTLGRIAHVGKVLKSVFLRKFYVAGEQPEQPPDPATLRTFWI